MKNKKSKKTVKSTRLSFPSDEKLHPWLTTLIDAYSVVDSGIRRAIRKEEKKDRILACSRGCSACCATHRDIPVYPLELVGISWYVTEKVSGDERRMLAEQLSNHREDSPCPFLVSTNCSIHPMRPISCRQFNVFGNVCVEGEDPYYTRRGDVLQPVKEHVDQAFFIMLPFYGVEKESERVKLVEEGAMHRMVRVLQDCNWRGLALKMEEYDKKKGQE